MVVIGQGVATIDQLPVAFDEFAIPGRVLADRHSGYKVGGTSPLGTRKSMPIYMEASVAELDKIYLNGGARGFLVGIAPADVIELLSPTMVEAAIE